MRNSRAILSTGDGTAPENKIPSHRLRRSVPNGAVQGVPIGAARKPVPAPREERRRHNPRRAPPTENNHMGRHAAAHQQGSHAGDFVGRTDRTDDLGLRRGNLQVRAAAGVGEVHGGVQDGVDRIRVQGRLRRNLRRPQREEAPGKQLALVGGHVAAGRRLRAGLRGNCVDRLAEVRSLRRSLRVAARQFTFVGVKFDDGITRVLQLISQGELLGGTQLSTK